MNRILLNSERYPERQKTRYAGDRGGECDDGTVVEFSKAISFVKPIERVELCYPYDATSQLWVNGAFLGTGPVLVGGDFLANDRPRTNRYYSSPTLTGGEVDHLTRRLRVDALAEGRLEFLARVRLCPVQICESSMGRGGFALSAEVRFADGASTAPPRS